MEPLQTPYLDMLLQIAKSAFLSLDCLFALATIATDLKLKTALIVSVVRANYTFLGKSSVEHVGRNSSRDL